MPEEPRPEEGSEKSEVVSAPAQPSTRDADRDDAPPPMVSPARGPMDQLTPDVPTGSTPLTRHDD